MIVNVCLCNKIYLYKNVYYEVNEIKKISMLFIS